MNRFSVEQIVAVLKQIERGLTVPEASHGLTHYCANCAKLNAFLGLTLI